MFDFLSLRWLWNAIASIQLQLARIESTVTDINAEVNAKLDFVEAAINLETEQATLLRQTVAQLNAEIVLLRQQLGEFSPLSVETLARITGLSEKIGLIVPDTETTV